MAKKVSTPSLDNWQVESFRLTAFLASNEAFDPGPWWEEMTASIPEKQSNSPRVNVKQYEGRLENGYLSLTTNPLRIDWVFGVAWPQDQLQAAAQDFNLGSWDTVQKTLLRRLQEWLKKAPALNRLAFGAALNLPVKDREHGLVVLQPLVPSVKIDSKGIRDLSYTINRPRKSSTDLFSEPLNRLSTWAVARRLPLLIALTPGAGNLSAKDLASAGNFIRLELDISTPSEHESPIPKERLGEILSELSGMAKEIVTKGDVA